MKRSLAVSLATLLLSPVFSHVLVKPVEPRELQAADPLQTIRQQYAVINKRLARYKKVKKKLSGFSLEGGELVAYLDGPRVVKIVATHYGEGGKAAEEYYYSQGKLIFVYRKDYGYDRPLSGKVVGTQENRFYFQSARLIRWINEDGKAVATDAAEFQQSQDEYLQISTKFVNAVRSKNSTIEAEP